MPEPTAAAQAFWHSVRQQLGLSDATPYQTFYFGMGEPMATQLAQLVVRGRKRATTSLLQTQIEQPAEAPVLGGYSVVTNVAGEPAAVIRTVALHLFRFRDVPAWFAEREGEDEGEDDVCLASWKAGHARYFTRYLAAQGQTFDEQMEVICESFDLLAVHPAFDAAAARRDPPTTQPTS